MMSDCKHCPHPSGKETSNSFSGFQEVICCKCGIKGVRRFEYKEESLPGHGPFYYVLQQLYEPNDQISWS